MTQITTTVTHHSIGTTDVRIRIHEAPGAAREAGVCFVNVHDNENYAVEATLRVLEAHGGRFVELAHSGERYIEFQLAGQGQVFAVDPNRIFSGTGRRQNDRGENYGAHPPAVAAVNNFAAHLLQILTAGSPRLIVAVHNNTGLRMEACLPDTERAATSGSLASCDFLLVTKRAFFDSLSARGRSVVLQDNGRVTDDGSLSVYMRNNPTPYVNVEVKSTDRSRAEAVALQERMLDDVVGVVLNSVPV